MEQSANVLLLFAISLVISVAVANAVPEGGCVAQFLRTASIPAQRAIQYERTFPNRSVTPERLQSVTDPYFIGLFGITDAGDRSKLAACNSGQVSACRTFKYCSGHGTCRRNHAWKSTLFTPAYQCHCQTDFTGNLCQTRRDPCTPNNPCANDGVCRRLGLGSDYECDCARGYVGPTCQSHILTQTELDKHLEKVLDSKLAIAVKEIKSYVHEQVSSINQQLLPVASSLNTQRLILQSLPLVNGRKGLYLFVVSGNWHQAVVRCRSMGGELAAPRTDAEQARAVHLMRAHRNPDAAWINGNDLQSEGVWRDVQGHRLGYARWAGGQPDNLGGNEHCLEIWTATGYKWNDNVCGAVRQSFLCRF